MICVDGKAFAAGIRSPADFQILIESVQDRLLRQIIAVCGDLRQPSVTSDALYDPQILSLQDIIIALGGDDLAVFHPDLPDILREASYLL